MPKFMKRKRKSNQLKCTLKKNKTKPKSKTRQSKQTQVTSLNNQTSKLSISEINDGDDAIPLSCHDTTALTLSTTSDQKQASVTRTLEDYQIDCTHSIVSSICNVSHPDTKNNNDNNNSKLCKGDKGNFNDNSENIKMMDNKHRILSVPTNESNNINKPVRNIDEDIDKESTSKFHKCMVKQSYMTMCQQNYSCCFQTTFDDTESSRLLFTTFATEMMQPNLTDDRSTQVYLTNRKQDIGRIFVCMDGDMKQYELGNISAKDICHEMISRNDLGRGDAHSIYCPTNDIYTKVGMIPPTPSAWAVVNNVTKKVERLGTITD